MPIIMIMMMAIMMIIVISIRMDTDLTVERLSTTTSRHSFHLILTRKKHLSSSQIKYDHKITIFNLISKIIIIIIPPQHHHHQDAHNQAEFPNFSWRGYAGFSQLQDEVVFMIVMRMMMTTIMITILII